MIYLDNAASTKMCKSAIEALVYWSENCLNPSAAYNAANPSRDIVYKTRELIARELNCTDLEIYFTSGGSESDNWAFHTVTKALKEKGKHILVSAVEHPAVMECAKYYAKNGFEVEILPVNDDGIIDLTCLKSKVRPDTILVSVMTANNEVGSLQPIKEIGEFLQDKLALFHTDAVQAFMHEKIDVKACHIDLLSLSAHKFNGPKGIGALYINEDKRELYNLPALILGGSQERERRAGTTAVPLIAAMGAAIEFHQEHFHEFRKHIKELQDFFITELQNRFPACSINGSLSQRLVNNINVCLPHLAGEEALIMLDFNEVLASHGSACASGSLDPSPVLLAMGKSLEAATSSLRFSLGYENTKEDILKTLDVLENLA